MAANLWLASLLLGLAFWSPVESPPKKLQCEPEEEYAVLGRHCCKKCPAGTYVGESCIHPHTMGICESCNEEVDYTAHANGLDICLPCDECKPGLGFRTVRPCTVKSNTECQCKEGYYCPPTCEQCVKCKTKCPEGQKTIQKCNATTDMKCGSPTTEAGYYPWLLVGIGFVICLFICLCCCWMWHRRNVSKRVEGKCDKYDLLPHSSESQRGESGPILENELLGDAERSNLTLDNRNEEPIPGNIPSAPPLQVLDESASASLQPNLQESRKQPSVDFKDSFSLAKLNEIYYGVKNMVLVHDWKILMRKTGLSDIDIEKIECDYRGDTDEQQYQMLKLLQNRFGIKNAVLKLLNDLWDFPLRDIYNNLINELINKGIIIPGPKSNVK